MLRLGMVYQKLLSCFRQHIGSQHGRYPGTASVQVRQGYYQCERRVFVQPEMGFAVLNELLILSATFLPAKKAWSEL